MLGLYACALVDEIEMWDVAGLRVREVTWQEMKRALEIRARWKT